MKKNKFLTIIILILSMLLCGCSGKKYKISDDISLGTVDNLPILDYSSAGDEYALVSANETLNAESYQSAGSALLIDDTNNQVVVSYNPHEKIYPASMTKLMTGLLVIEAIEDGDLSLDDVITLQSTVTFNESNVGVSNLVGGCKIDVQNLLYGLLIRSYNDCAVILAREIAGSEDAFVELMNQRAQELGATNTHFVNSHGLHSEDHYTTAYDLYLIFEEFTSHDLSYVIDSLQSYDFTYTDANNVEQKVEISATNGFLSGEYNFPEGYSLGSWKSGTTNAAGNCLIIEFVNDSTGNKFYGVIAGAESREVLYTSMTSLVNEGK